MLRLSKTQCEAFRLAARADMVAATLDHLRGELPEIWADVEEDDGVAAVEFGMQRAEDFGFDSEHEVVRFIELMSLSAPDLGDTVRDQDALNLLRNGEFVANWRDARTQLVAMVDGDNR